MKSFELKENERILIPKCWKATSFCSRLLGLMGRKELVESEAMYFPNCNSIHTLFMRFPIDVIFLDKAGKVLETCIAVKPWRVLFPRWKSKAVIELPAFRVEALGIKVGCTLRGF